MYAQRKELCSSLIKVCRDAGSDFLELVRARAYKNYTTHVFFFLFFFLCVCVYVNLPHPEWDSEELCCEGHACEWVRRRIQMADATNENGRVLETWRKLFSWLPSCTRRDKTKAVFYKHVFVTGVREKKKVPKKRVWCILCARGANIAMLSQCGTQYP